MIPTRITVVPIHPSTHVRSTKNEGWLFAVSDEYLEGLDQRRLEEKGKVGGLLRRKKQLEIHNAHKQEIRDWVKRSGFTMPHGYFAMWFYVPMPASWRKPKRAKMLYTVHQTTPDIDNFAKQLFDNIMPRRNRAAKQKGADDRKLHCYATFKVWVEYDEACSKIVEYDPAEFLEVFKDGHPLHGVKT